MTTWEEEPLKELTRRKELNAYLHKGFWQPMDTLRDRQRLEQMWKEERQNVVMSYSFWEWQKLLSQDIRFKELVNNSIN